MPKCLSKPSFILILSYLLLHPLPSACLAKWDLTSRRKFRRKFGVGNTIQGRLVFVSNSHAIVLPGEADEKGRYRSEILPYNPDDAPEKPSSNLDGSTSRLPYRIERAYLFFRADYKACTCVFDFLQFSGLDNKGKIWYTFLNEDKIGWEKVITLESEYYLSTVRKNPGLKPVHRGLVMFLQLGARMRFRFFAYARLAKIIRPWKLVKAPITREFEQCLEDLMGFMPR